MEYYVWDTEEQAQAALDFINDSGWFPMPGYKSGELAPESTQTTCWVEEPRQRLDGKWCFQRVPADVMDAVGVSEEQRTQFLTAFAPSIEEYEASWFPTEED